MARAVRAGDELALAERLVGDDLHRRPDRPDRARIRAEGLADLVLGRRAEGLSERLEHLPLVESIVAAHQAEDDLRRS